MSTLWRNLCGIFQWTLCFLPWFLNEFPSNFLSIFHTDYILIASLIDRWLCLIVRNLMKLSLSKFYSWKSFSEFWIFQSFHCFPLWILKNWGIGVVRPSSIGDQNQMYVKSGRTRRLQVVRQAGKDQGFDEQFNAITGKQLISFSALKNRLESAFNILGTEFKLEK